MCSTCDDPKSTNSILCGAAQEARDDEAELVYDLRRTMTFREIAERQDCSKQRVQKLYNHHRARLIDPDQKVDMALHIEQMEEAIAAAWRDYEAALPQDKARALEAWGKMWNYRAKLTDLYPAAKVRVKTEPAEPHPIPPAIRELYEKTYGTAPTPDTNGSGKKTDDSDKRNRKRS